MIKKAYIIPSVKVVEINYGQRLMNSGSSYSTSGLDDFDGYGGESIEDDEAD